MEYLICALGLSLLLTVRNLMDELNSFLPYLKYAAAAAASNVTSPLRVLK